MDFYLKYLKYKQKYLILKGGTPLKDIITKNILKYKHLLSVIIQHVNKIIIDTNADTNTDNYTIKLQLIFNILLYGVFIIREKILNDQDFQDLGKKIQKSKLDLGSKECNNKIIRKEICDYINNNLLDIIINDEINLLCKEDSQKQNFICVLKKYALKYYDNYPEIFNYNYDFLNKEINNYNINDFFGLIFMTIKNYKSKVYIDLLLKIKEIKLPKISYRIFNTQMTIQELIGLYDKNKLNNEKISYNKTFNRNYKRIKVADLKKINFIPSKSTNKFLLFKFLNDDLQNYRTITSTSKLFIKYNEDNINDFDILLDCKIIMKDLFNLVDIPYFNITEITELNSFYNQNYINVKYNPNKAINSFTCKRNKDNIEIERSGINFNENYNRLYFLSSYDSSINPENYKNTKGDSHYKDFMYNPSLTDHPGFLIMLNSTNNDLVKIISLNISEYQEKKRGTPTMPLDNNIHNYKNRLFNIFYLLIKVLKKENIEFCMLQELFKTNQVCNNLTPIIIDNLKDLIDNYINIFGYKSNIKNKLINNYNYIIYKDNYCYNELFDINSNGVTTIRIGNTYIGSNKYKRKKRSKLDEDILYLFIIICEAMRCFNKNENIETVIFVGDQNINLNDFNKVRFFKKYMIKSNSIDHAIIFTRCDIIDILTEFFNLDHQYYLELFVLIICPVKNRYNTICKLKLVLYKYFPELFIDSNTTVSGIFDFIDNLTFMDLGKYLFIYFLLYQDLNEPNIRGSEPIINYDKNTLPIFCTFNYYKSLDFLNENVFHSHFAELLKFIHKIHKINFTN
jgi:hypothetical protein